MAPSDFYANVAVSARISWSQNSGSHTNEQVGHIMTLKSERAAEK